VPGYFHPLVHSLRQRVARFYVAGPEVEDALDVGRAWNAGPVTICAWNKDNDFPEENARRCVAGIDALRAAQLDGRVAFKPRDLGFSHDLVGHVLDHARTCGVPLHFDSMGPEAVAPTLALINGLHRRGDELGTTLPARWRRSAGDATRAINLGLSVRVVKGQWADPDEPFLDVRSNFLALIDRLAGRARHVAVATHDPLLARAALEKLRDRNTPCELELLLGLPMRGVLPCAEAFGVPVRLYVPYGYAWLPYSLQQVRRRPRVALWILRDVLLRRRAGDVALRSSRNRAPATRFAASSARQPSPPDCG
jgi:proline dehydrogenase